MTLLPRMSVTNKPLDKPLAYVDVASFKESLHYVNFQVLLYYLSNVLMTILPLFEQASKFSIVRKGYFAHVEEPEKVLRQDKNVRNLNLDTFSELRT